MDDDYIELTMIGVEFPPVDLSCARWVRISDTPGLRAPYTDMVMLAVPDNPANETLYVRLDLPEHIYLPILDDRVDAPRVPPTLPDVTIDVSASTVTYADTDPADLARRAAGQFPFPKSLTSWVSRTPFDTDVLIALMSALMYPDIAGVLGAEPCVFLVIGGVAQTYAAAQAAVLLLNRFQQDVAIATAMRENRL